MRHSLGASSSLVTCQMLQKKQAETAEPDEKEVTDELKGGGSATGKSGPKAEDAIPKFASQGGIIRRYPCLRGKHPGS
eukprot:192582-Chlamydomonas_euryale.AAC.2